MYSCSAIVENYGGPDPHNKAKYLRAKKRQNWQIKM